MVSVTTRIKQECKEVWTLYVKNKVGYIKEFKDIAKYLKENVKNNDMVFVMGADYVKMSVQIIQ